jgi:hypothetical protein
MKEFKESVPVDSSSVYIYPKPISVDLYDTWKSFSKPAQVFRFDSLSYVMKEIT